MTPRTVKRIAILTVLALPLLAFVFQRSWFADLSHAALRAIDLCRDAGPLAFFAAMALLPAFGFPLAPFVLSAGPAFAPRLGLGGVIACALLAVTADVALSYAIAARLLRPAMTRLVHRLGYRLPVVTGDSAFFATLALRLVPGPPFFLQSYLLGLARVPFVTYMLVSTLVPASYLIATIVLADALVRRDPWAIAAAAGIFLVAGGLLHQFRRRFTASSAPSAPADPLRVVTAPVAAARTDSPAR